MFVATAALLLMAVLAFLFLVREQDLPQTAPAVPWLYLEQRKAAIYENLRDLTFEYRVGKLSDADYEATKSGLQGELAGVLAEIDRLKGQPVPTETPKLVKSISQFECPHCGAKFDRTLKFCGECGKPMGANA